MSADPALASASKLAARAARFSNTLPGNRYKELEEARAKEVQQHHAQQRLVRDGKVELEDAVEMRGTCEKMCSDYEREFREWTREVHPFEATPDKRMDPAKAVAAYSRSDAGAGHGTAAILPSDLRTPRTLIRTLDYLFTSIMTLLPPSSSDLPPNSELAQRKALGYSAGFIRDRTRAIRKEFAMQSSWGHEEAIESFERIARWHILCLRELQEEEGTNNDMHIDSAELGRCFTSLRQHYNDRREESGLDMPCSHEPEFRAYMLVYDLTSKSISIPTSELPSSILSHPLVKIAWEIRRSAQRNFDSQKEGSKHNAELGMNNIRRFIKLLSSPKVPYLLACLVEIRLREMRRSALRAMTRAYPRLKTEPIRVNEKGEVVERRMVLIETLNKILGCLTPDSTLSAWDDVPSRSAAELDPDNESEAICRRFNIPLFPADNEGGEKRGALINLGTPFDDNKDAPYTRRWALVSAKRGGKGFVQVVNSGSPLSSEGSLSISVPLKTTAQALAAPVSAFGGPGASSAFDFKKTLSSTTNPSSVRPIEGQTSMSAFSFGSKTGAGSAFGSTSTPATVSNKPSSPAFNFGFSKPSSASVAPPAHADAPRVTPAPAGVSLPSNMKTASTLGTPPLFSFSPSQPAKEKEKEKEVDAKAKGVPDFFSSAAPAPAPASASTGAVSTPTSAPLSIPPAAMGENKASIDVANAKSKESGQKDKPGFSFVFGSTPTSTSSKPTSVPIPLTSTPPIDEKSRKRAAGEEGKKDEARGKPELFPFSAHGAASSESGIKEGVKDKPLFSFTATPGPSALGAPTSATASATAAPPLGVNLNTGASTVPPLTPASSTTPHTIVRSRSHRDPSLLLSTSSPASQLHRLSPSLSKSTSKISLDVYHAERLQRRQAIPSVCEELVVQVMKGILRDCLTPDLEALVKQQLAERTYAARKAYRSEAIKSWSQVLFRDHFLLGSTNSNGGGDRDGLVREIAKEAMLDEIRRRWRAREAGRWWKLWAKDKRERREGGERKRREWVGGLKEMGLGASMGPSVTVLGAKTNGVGDVSMDVEMDSMDAGLDSLRLDIEIIQAERDKDNFFAPSTFLTSIARYVAPQLSSAFTSTTISLSDSASSSGPESTALSPHQGHPTFITLLSTPSGGSSADRTVEEWLVSKFTPPNSSSQLDQVHDGDAETTPDGEKEGGYMCGGVEFDLRVVNNGMMSKHSRDDGWMGLVVFEAPLKTTDAKKASENIANAQDRMGLLVKTLQDDGNRFVPGLIVLSWEDESMDDLAERLQIQSEVASFSNKSFVSLGTADDLDQLFAKALEGLGEVEVKEQGVVRLQDVAERVLFYWKQFVDVTGILLSQRRSDAHLGWTCLKSGIELINSIPRLAREFTGARGLDNGTVLDSIALPEITFDAPSSNDKLVDQVAGYFENKIFMGIDELSLLIVRLSQAAQYGHALPIDSILQFLSFFVLGELQHRHLVVRTFFVTETEMYRWQRDHLRRVISKFGELVEKEIQLITSIAEPPSSSHTIVELPPIRTSSPITISKITDTTSTTIITPTGKKRPRGEKDERAMLDREKKGKKENKAAKAERLLKLMQKVERTLSERDNII
ncbi:nuclear export factor [Cryptococcus neoformans]|nr:nuclear export factor [Cryptococcus neoformans var. grubii Th84]OXH09334.1 nuclear export factor [Cryptococcus neoformans var. grubii]OXH30415.1 nuclear export factor [Cryptococcus neoformans var. grubii]OXH50434.1 nuclear export factor [Cryptococcus neoformans var. grubii]OXH51103.1 nuclear export factor [Cryptococcus neoformans var. grubii]